MEKQVFNYQHQQQYQHNNNSTNNGLIRPPQSADFLLRWGNRKRLRCMKIQVKDEPTSVHKTTVRVDRRVVRSDDDDNHNNVSNGHCVVNGGGVSTSHGHFNLRQRRAAAPVQASQRILRSFRLVVSSSSSRKRIAFIVTRFMQPSEVIRLYIVLGNPFRNNSESGSGQGMKGSNGVRGMVGSPESGEKKGSGAHQSQENINNNMVVKATAPSDKIGGGSSSGGSDVIVWPPKFMIGLSNKEKEEDFMAIKGSKLPHRPKKRAKYIQRTLNLVSPGGWLCDLTLERYEVREKKTTKKRPRGLKAMGNYIDSDSD